MKRKSKRVQLGIVFLFILVITLCSVMVIAPGPPSHVVLPPQAEAKIPNFVVNNIWGEVNYGNNIFSNNPQVALQNAVSIGFHTISVDDVTFPELNVPANIEFNSAYYSNPIILRNGIWQQDLVPTPTGFGSWEVAVNGFSTYQIVESNFSNGTFYDTTIADLGSGNGLTLDSDAILIVNFEDDPAIDESLQQHTITNESILPTNSSYGIDGTGGVFMDGLSGSNYNIGGVDYELLEDGTNFTINMWVKPNGYNRGGLYSAISTTPAEYAIDIEMWGGTGVPYFFIGNGTDSDIAVSSIAAPLDEWSMLTFIFDGIDMKIYHNNVLTKTETVVLGGIYPKFIPTTQHRIGRSQYGSWNFNGSMDNFYMFDRVITEEERNVLYWSNQKQVLFADQAIFPNVAMNFNNGSAYDYVNEEVLGVSGGSFLSNGLDNTTGYVTDGTNIDGISTFYPTFGNHTFSAWIKPDTVQPAGTNLAFTKGSHAQQYYSVFTTTDKWQTALRDLSGSQRQCNSLTNVTWDEWTHFVAVTDGTTQKIYLNGVLDKTCAGIYIGGRDSSTEYDYIGSYGTGSVDYAGTMDSIMIFEEVLDDAQVFTLYNESAPLYLYKQSGNYESQTFNSTAINPEIQVNLWESVELTNYLTFDNTNYTNLMASNIQYMASDDPGFPGGSWVSLGFNGSHYLPEAEPSQNGIYGKYLINMNTLDPYGLYPENVLQVTMNNYQYTLPWVTNATIPLTAPTTLQSTTGYATSSLNDTDSMQMNFFWYVNGINVLNESSIGQVNGSEADSTLGSSNYVKYDVINFVAVTCLEDQPAVCSNPVWSNNATVQNSNYNYTVTPPTNNTIQITKPQGRMFAITFTTDIDNDATVSWLVDGTEVSTADSLTLGSSLYLDYAILTLVANITDGQYNNTETWTVEILPTEIQAVGAISLTMFILFVIGIFFFLPFFAGKFTKNEFVNLILKRGCWVIAIYLGMNAAAIMATIAENSGLPLTQEMFTYMWILGVAGYLMMGFMVLKTLFDVVDMYKLNKNTKRMGD